MENFFEEIAAAYEEGYRDVEAAKKVQNAERKAQNAVFEGSGDVEADTRTGYSDIETLERMLEGSEGGTQSAAGDITDVDGTSGRRPLQEVRRGLLTASVLRLRLLEELRKMRNSELGIRNQAPLRKFKSSEKWLWSVIIAT